MSGATTMLFIAGILSIPFYGYFIWGLIEPEEAIVFLDKWRYDEPPQFSEIQMMLFKFGNIFGIGMTTIILIILGFETFSG